MCGICGIFGAHDRKVIKPMTESLTHRGPDDLGYFYHRDLVSLGHRRLSIIGLDSGKQPIFNEDKSIAVVFNGEIYNYKELRTSLESQGHKFVTNTDTEVIPHLYEQYGEDFANHLNGDFSIALFDSRFEILYLIRDRFGIRTIYYHRDESGFVFGSEIKALRASGMVSTELDREALNYYMTLRYVPDEMTLFQGVRKVKPGTMVKLTKDSIEFKKWYNLKYSEDYQTSENEQVEQFRDLLSDAVRLRMRSDVPVGAFLSGGIDSSVIVAMAAEHTNDMKTFSVGFRSSVDENADARRLAEFIGTDHHDFYVGKDDYKEITGIVRRMDEPIGDFILLPTYLLNRHASEKVKVVLTGEGADEILGGYLHHLILNRIWDYRKLLGKPVTSAIAMGLKQMPPSFLNMFFLTPHSLENRGKRSFWAFWVTSASYFRPT
ncbi:MAG: asparagine synthase (glutamine-hydrolyzing) [Candidatus Lindowbacteria bacterium]|nr:asparagine synthase (glutamine-hydrolyzing) [Candidatus Lindowbacteria bacterium]